LLLPVNALAADYPARVRRRLPTVDTLTVFDGGGRSQVKIRFTWNRRARKAGGQDFGKPGRRQAAQRLGVREAGGRSKSGDKDRYGRMVAEVILPGRPFAESRDGRQGGWRGVVSQIRFLPIGSWPTLESEAKAEKRGPVEPAERPSRRGTGRQGEGVPQTASVGRQFGGKPGGLSRLRIAGAWPAMKDTKPGGIRYCGAGGEKAGVSEGERIVNKDIFCLSPRKGSFQNLGLSSGAVGPYFFQGACHTIVRPEGP